MTRKAADAMFALGALIATGGVALFSVALGLCLLGLLIIVAGMLLNLRREGGGE